MNMSKEVLHKRSKQARVIFLLVVMLLVGCKSDDNEEVEPVIDMTGVEIVTVNVDVVLPKLIQEQWKYATEWALENIEIGQQKLSRRVKLNLRYHDEDTADLQELAYKLTHPQAGEDTCHAIIGPYHSDNAQIFLNHAAQTRLPVVMPTCTSSELQRANARNTYAWFLTESDITQCEIMMSIAQASSASDVALVYSDDTYGHSFRDWFAYYAAELDLHIAGGITNYKKGDDLKQFLNETKAQAKGKNVRVLVALSDASDYLDVCNQIMAACDSKVGLSLKPICSNTSCDLQVLSIKDFDSFDIGVTSTACVSFGFSQAYSGLFDIMPLNGEPQMYDALTLIALGAAHQQASPDSCYVGYKKVVYDKPPYEPGLTDFMRSITASEEMVQIKWDAAGLARAFSELAARRPIDIIGASSPFDFDYETFTKALNTTYMVWKLAPFSQSAKESPYQRVEPIINISTADTDNQAAYYTIWQFEKRMQQAFDNLQDVSQLPDVTDRWAVVISPSTTWENYRHQADAFSMYQLLRQYGYDDDHIVLIVEDNLAYSQENKDFPGQIFVERGDATYSWEFTGKDVRKDAVVDYHFSQLTPDDIAHILQGRQSERLPHVIHPDSTSNVFFFWSGHGGMNGGPLWGNEDSKVYFGTDRIRSIVEEMAGTAAANNSQFSILRSATSGDASLAKNSQFKKYRRMMFVLETCYSGQWGEALTGLPDLLVLTAANAYETSKADNFDQQLGVYLSNAFSLTFLSKVSKTSNVTLYDLYRELFKATNGSHVTIYNNDKYGSVYTETMKEFFPTN